MAESLNPAASHHLPSFITPPGETDVLMVIMAIVLLLSVLGFGILFLRLHTLPERMAHRTHKLQFEIVAVLGLIALFTHQHIFWVAGLLLALIDLPDFGTMLGRIAGSVERMAGIKPGEGAAENSPDLAERSDKASAEAHAGAKKSDGPPARPLIPQTSRTNEKELDHA
jgi:hypothetical protein